MGADLTTMAAVDNTAVAEMKWEEGSCRSSHPHAWSVGGACNARLQIWQIGRKKSRTENKEKATTDLLAAFGCFAGNGGAHRRRRKEEGRKPLWISAAARISRRRVEETRRHCTQSQKMPRVLQHRSRSFL
jgi:hypothetical protein